MAKKDLKETGLEVGNGVVLRVKIPEGQQVPGVIDSISSNHIQLVPFPELIKNKELEEQQRSLFHGRVLGPTTYWAEDIISITKLIA